ncbi:CaiB/BaiF CoA transferase family protein [Chloroflexota bacterium]
MESALGDIKILDVTGIGAAPLAAMMLGDMGAEVIRIDTPPKSATKGAGHGIISQTDFELLAFNRNKMSLALDLKSDHGRRIFLELTKTADVIVESFRPGAMQRLGLGYDVVSELNPGIIYCSISAYGQNGPYHKFPAHDANAAAMGGLLGLIGEGNDTRPVIPQDVAADLAVAVFQSVIGILLALRARDRTGRGQWVDISMHDGVVFLLIGIREVSEYLHSGCVPQRGDTMLSGTRPYYSVYKTKDDKYITVCPLEPHFWQNLCTTLHCEHLISAQFSPSPTQEKVSNELSQIFMAKTRDEWFDILIEANVPVGKVLDVDEVFSDPHVLHRDMLIEIDHPEHGKVKQIGFGIKLSDTAGRIRSLPPRLGQHTDELLSTIGYTTSHIAKLREDGVIY